MCPCVSLFFCNFFLVQTCPIPEWKLARAQRRHPPNPRRPSSYNLRASTTRQSRLNLRCSLSWGLKETFSGKRDSIATAAAVKDVSDNMFRLMAILTSDSATQYQYPLGRPSIATYFLQFCILLYFKSHKMQSWHSCIHYTHVEITRDCPPIVCYL